jgi:hypothetical protein
MMPGRHSRQVPHRSGVDDCPKLFKQGCAGMRRLDWTDVLSSGQSLKFGREPADKACRAMTTHPHIPPDTPRDIAAAVYRWSRDGRGGSRRRSRLEVLLAMANGHGKTPAEHEMSIVQARAWIRKHDADMMGPPDALQKFDNGTRRRFEPRTPRRPGPSVADRRCAHCAGPMPKSALTGRPRTYCSGACQVAASRARHAA